MNKWIFLLSTCFTGLLHANAQPLLDTGSQKMPSAIDKNTHHKLIRLTNSGSRNRSFCFHNSKKTASSGNQELHGWLPALDEFYYDKLQTKNSS